MNRKPLAALAAALIGVALTGCSPTPANTGSTSTSPGATTPATSATGVTLVNPGTLTVCSNPPFDPMEVTDSSGAIVGFDIDVMQALADTLGVKMNVISTDFAQITSGASFAAKKCDIGASAISITDARKEALTFSVPYFDATQALMAKTGSGITGLADLKGKKLVVQSDTTGADYAKQYADQNGYSVVYFDDVGAGLSSVLSGQNDAALMDNAIVRKFVADNPSTAVVTEFQTGEQYGYAAGKDDNGVAMINLVNQVLAKADSDGTYLKLYQKWIDPKATSAGLPKAG